jgi:hypothetical protein
MVKHIGIAAAALLLLAPAARAGETKETKKPDARAVAAAELSRMVLTPDTWDRTLKAAQTQTAQQLVQMVKGSGGSVAPEFEQVFGEEFAKMLPYQEIVEMQATLLAKHYTEPEIRQLVAFYKTPLGQKMIRVMPDVTADVTAWSMTTMQQRIGAVMERIKPLVRGPEDAPAAKEPATAPAAEPATAPAK